METLPERMKRQGIKTWSSSHMHSKDGTPIILDGKQCTIDGKRAYFMGWKTEILDPDARIKIHTEEEIEAMRKYDNE